MRLSTTFSTYSSKTSFSILAFFISLFSAFSVVAQTSTYTQGALVVNVTGSNPCGGTGNGSLTFSVISAASGVTQVRLLFVSGPPDAEDNYSLFPVTPLIINVGSSFTFNGADNSGNPLSSPSLIDGVYDFFIREVTGGGANFINTTSGLHPPKTLLALPVITLTPTSNNDLSNVDCASPLEAELEVAIGGGSTSFGGGGSFSYTWSSTTAITGMPSTGTVAGVAPVLNLKTILGVSGLPGGTYTLVVNDDFSDCSQTLIQTIVDPSPQDFILTTSTPIICDDSPGVIMLSGSESSSPSPGVSYELFVQIGAGPFVSTGVTSGATGSALTFNIPASQLAASNTYTYQVIASNGICTPRTMTGNPTIIVNPLPIATFSGLSPSYCVDAAAVTLTPTVLGGAFSGPGVTGNTFTPATAGVGGPYSITYTITDGNSCTNSTTQTVSVTALPIATFSGLTASYCLNNGPVTLTPTTVGGTFSGPGVTGNTFTPATAGVGGPYSITYTITDGSSCTNSTTQTVSVTALPIATFSGLSPSYCVDAAAVTLTPTVLGGTFSGPGVTGNTFTPATAGVGGPYSITYTITDGSSCTNSTTQTVSVTALPIATFSGLSPSYCVDAAAVTLTPTVLGGTFSGPGVTGNTFTPATAGVGGPYSITYTITDGSSCTNSTTQTVSVTALPIATFSGLSPSYCVDAAAVTLTPTVLGGTFSGPGVTGNTFTPATAGVGGPYSITYTITDGSSCTNSTTQTVSVTALPIATFSGLSPSYCVDAAAVTLTPTVLGGTFSGPGVTGNTFTPATAGVGGPYSITYTITDGSSCTNSTTQTVSVTALPIATFSGLSPSYCVDAAAVTLTPTVLGGTFSGPGVTGNTFTPATAGVGGPYSITYTITDGSSCTNSTTQTVSVTALPIATFSGLSPSYCVDAAAVTLTPTVLGGTFSGPGVTGNTFTPATAGVGGPYSITYTITDGSSCTNSTTQTVSVTALPIATFSGLSPSYCVDAAAVTLTPTVLGGTFSGPGVTGNTFTPATAGVGGPYSITYTITDGSSCTNSTTQTVSVTALPIATFSGLSPSYCVDAAAVTLTPTVLGGTFSGPGVTGNTFTPATAGVGGPYSITYTITDGSSCTNSTTQTVSVTALPIATFSGLSPSYCVDAAAVTLTPTVLGGTFSGPGVTGNTFTPATAGVGGPYSITYTITDGSSCTNSTTQTVSVTALPIATFSGLSPSYCVDAAAVTLTPTVLGGTFSGPGVTGNTFTPATAGVGGPYSITYTITDGSSCTNSTTQTVSVTALPIATFSGLSPSYCVDAAAVTLTPTVLGGTFSGPGVTGNTFTPATAGVGGPYSITYTITDGSSCTNSTSQIIMVQSPPSIALTVGTTIANVCTGGISGITIAASQVGVNYQLRNNADNSLVGSSTPGTGGTITLSTGVMTVSMVFNVLADNGVCVPVQLSSTASVNVSGTLNASLSVNPASSAICSGSSTSIQISNSETGVTYQLRDNFNNSLIGTAISGTGVTLNLPTNAITSATTYNVLADNGSCQITLTNLATVNIQPNPNGSLTVAALIATLCSGDNTNVTISNSETGVSYQLRNDSNDSPVGLTVAGTGSTISLPTGSLTVSTVFNVLATGLCTSIELVNKATITVAGAVNQNLAVSSPTPSICVGTASVVRITNSEVGVSYQLRNDTDNSTIGTAVAGTGTTIDLPTGTLSTVTAFNVLASTGTCSIQLTNKVTITTDAAPNATITVTSSTTCSGVDTSVDLASEVGVIYQLRLDADDSFVGAAIIGNGSLAKIHVEAPTSTTTYNILATRASCSIELTTLATITVLPANDPLCMTAGGGTGECATVVITAMSSPATCNSSNGSVSFGINPAVPMVNNVGVRITVVGTSPNNSGVAFTNSNDNFFINNVPHGGYDYTIVYGDLSCVKTGKVTVAKTGGVADPVATNIIEPLCFGDASGSVKIDVAGETGNTLQWSLDAVNWKNFVAGSQVTGIPSGTAPSFLQTISVRKNASDLCFGGVSIAMKGPLSALDTLSIKKVISKPDLATGTLLVDIIESGQGPYEAQLELIRPLFTGQVFAQDMTPIVRNALNLKYEIVFTGLYAGTYLLSIRDGLGCLKNYSIEIKADTDISIPNIFTPNGDGVNEVFYVRNLPEDAQLIVTNRWGTEVYSSKGYQNNWDGGSTVDGVYYYKLLAAGQTYTGWIEIQRGK